MGVLALFIYSFFVLLKTNTLWSNTQFAFIVFGLLFVVYMCTKGVGGGDIKLLTALAFYMGKDIMFLALPLTVLMFITLIWVVIAKKGLRYSIAFVPYIFASFFIWVGFSLAFL